MLREAWCVRRRPSLISGLGTPFGGIELRFEGEWPTAVALLGSGQRLAAANRAGLLCIWDLPDSREAAPSDKEFEPKTARFSRRSVAWKVIPTASRG